MSQVIIIGYDEWFYLHFVGYLSYLEIPDYLKGDGHIKTVNHQVMALVTEGSEPSTHPTMFLSTPRR